MQTLLNGSAAAVTVGYALLYTQIAQAKEPNLRFLTASSPATTNIEHTTMLPLALASEQLLLSAVLALQS